MKNMAFTMAEVLITLAIIGVVAALTIPELINKYEEQARVTALKKVYSTLSQAANLAIMEHGLPDTWDMKDYDVNSINTVFHYFKPYLNIIREQENEISHTHDVVYNLNGGVFIEKIQHNADDYQYCFTVLDGTDIIMDISEKRFDAFGVNIDSPQYLWFRVDINGDKKPNTLGKDIFHFVLTDKGLIPSGQDDSTNCDPNLEAEDAGRNCTAKVLKEGKFSYL